MRKTKVILGITILLGLGGCASTNVLEVEPVQIGVITPFVNLDCEQRARVIGDCLAAMDEISDCVVYISGKTAIVGITLAEDLERKELIALKKRAIAAAKAIDSQTNHVAVSTSANIYKKIDDLRPDTPADMDIHRELEGGGFIPINVAPVF